MALAHRSAFLGAAWCALLAGVVSTPAQADSYFEANAADIANGLARGEPVYVTPPVGRRQRLWAGFRGAADLLPVRPADSIYGVDAGTSRRGSPVAVYSRCLVSPKVSGAASS